MILSSVAFLVTVKDVSQLFLIGREMIRFQHIMKFSGSMMIGLHLLAAPASAEQLQYAAQRLAQATGAENSAIASPDVAASMPSYSMEDLSYLLAPIALYPDPLLALVLAASTFPVQVVEADAWIKLNRRSIVARDFSKVDAMPWDSSIHALARFPDEIAMLADHLDWSQSVGMAFARQPSDVSNAIQLLRAKAEKAGNLKSTPEQNVRIREDSGSRVIYIAPSNPERIYVPRYDPSVVFETILPGALVFTTE